MDRRLLYVVSSMVAMFFTVAGCGSHEVTPLEAAAGIARTYPFVKAADYHSQGWGERESLDIYVFESTTESQAEELWCDVLVPAGADATNAIVAYPQGVVQFEQPDCERRPR